MSMHLIKDDYYRLGELYPQHGAAKAVRSLIRAHLNRIDEKVALQAAALPEIDIDLGDDYVGDL